MQDLVEKVVMLRKAVEQTQDPGPSAVGFLLGEKMSQYASLLASQGSLTTAIAYLPQNTEQVNDTHNPFAPQSASECNVHSTDSNSTIFSLLPGCSAAAA